MIPTDTPPFNLKHRTLGLGLVGYWLLVTTTPAQASMFEGETLDSIANVISWAVLIIAPIVGIAVFWLIHILPEKIAHKRMHPQTGAIQCLCLLSLCFGGLLWPIAWLWAYSKPVLYKLAYGTDVDESLAHPKAEAKEMKGEVEAPRVAEPKTKSHPKGGKA